MTGITDVVGVRVAHVTLGEDGMDGEGAGHVARTGVPCVVPRGGDLLTHPVTAAAHVINGYGKLLGLAQVADLGELESTVDASRAARRERTRRSPGRQTARSPTRRTPLSPTRPTAPSSSSWPQAHP